METMKINANSKTLPNISKNDCENAISNCVDKSKLKELIKSLNLANDRSGLINFAKAQLIQLTEEPTDDDKRLSEQHRLKANDYLRKNDNVGAMKEFKREHNN